MSRPAPARRRVAAGILTGLLALQFAAASPWAAGTAPLPEGAVEAPSHHGAGANAGGAAVHAHPEGGGEAIATARPDPSPPMPCEEEGSCGWSLMQCAGAGACTPVPVLPAVPLPAALAVLVPAWRGANLPLPSSPSPTLHRPPPRA